MIEVLNIPELLRTLNGSQLSPIERVLVGHTGTVQVLLSIWFNDPVEITVVDQYERGGCIYREVNLVLCTSGAVVCRATSEIPSARNRADVLEDVRASQLGIGQIAAKHRIPTERSLVDFQVEDETITRTYEMVGKGLCYLVTERFPRAIYANSIQVKQWAVSV